MRERSGSHEQQHCKYPIIARQKITGNNPRKNKLSFTLKKGKTPIQDTAANAEYKRKYFDSGVPY